MIKINLDQITKDEIEDMYMKDAQKVATGIFKVLNTSNAKSILKNNHSKIYEVLYDQITGDLINENVKRLLLADRKELETYTYEFGCYASNKKMSDELLNEVFKYERYSKRKVVSDILRKMGVTVCPYCNRQYIFTVASRKVRPQLDHFFPKKEYPYLSLSLYNMVPSCSLCNMTKSSLNTVKKPVLYPYDEEMGHTARFEITIKKNSDFVKVMQGVSNEFVIGLNAEEAENKSVISNQMKKLHLDELYNNHIEYVMDIIKSKYINSPDRIDELRNKFPMIFHSHDEVKNLLYMTDIRKESWGKRPLSKLTYDIDKQLESGKIYIEQ